MGTCVRSSGINVCPVYAVFQNTGGTRSHAYCGRFGVAVEQLNIAANGNDTEVREQALEGLQQLKR